MNHHALILLLLASFAPSQCERPDSIVLQPGIDAAGILNERVVQEHRIQIAVTRLAGILPHFLNDSHQESGLTLFLPADSAFQTAVLQGDSEALARIWREDLSDDELKEWLQATTLKTRLSAQELPANGIVLDSASNMVRKRHLRYNGGQAREQGEPNVVSSIESPNTYIHTTDGVVWGISGGPQISTDGNGQARDDGILHGPPHRMSRRYRRSRKLAQLQELQNIVSNAVGNVVDTAQQAQQNLGLTPPTPSPTATTQPSPPASPPPAPTTAAPTPTPTRQPPPAPAPAPAPVPAPVPAPAPAPVPEENPAQVPAEVPTEGPSGETSLLSNVPAPAPAEAANNESESPTEVPSQVPVGALPGNDLVPAPAPEEGAPTPGPEENALASVPIHSSGTDLLPTPSPADSTAVPPTEPPTSTPTPAEILPQGPAPQPSEPPQAALPPSPEEQASASGSVASSSGNAENASGSPTGAIVGGVAGGAGAVAVLGGIAYWYRRRKRRSSDGGSGSGGSKGERSGWGSKYAQNREAYAQNRADFAEARAIHEAAIRDRVQSSKWWGGKKGQGSKKNLLAPGEIGDPKGFRAGTGPTDLEKLVGGKNKGVAHLHSFAAIDSTIAPASKFSPSTGSYDLMGTQDMDVVHVSGAAIPVPAVQDSAESYNKDSERSALAAMEHDSWQLSAGDITICKTPEGDDIMIGQGGFGAVYLGELFSSTQVAVKVLKSKDARSRESFLNEMSILKSLHHGNIVQFLGACLLQDTVALVTEFMPQGDLWHALSSDTTKELGFYKRGRSIAIDIARGTIYMHSKKIIHLDLKSANILLSRDGSAKIADVGLAKIMSRELTQVSARGSFDWVAPEVLRGDEVNDRADMWSLAVLLWEICSGERPQNRFIRELRVPEECPREISALIAKCRLEPQDRPSAKEFYESLLSSPMTPEGAAVSPQAVSPAYLPGPAMQSPSSREATSIIPKERQSPRRAPVVGSTVPSDAFQSMTLSSSARLSPRDATSSPSSEYFPPGSREAARSPPGSQRFPSSRGSPRSFPQSEHFPTTRDSAQYVRRSDTLPVSRERARTPPRSEHFTSRDSGQYLPQDSGQYLPRSEHFTNSRGYGSIAVQSEAGYDVSPRSGNASQFEVPKIPPFRGGSSSSRPPSSRSRRSQPLSGPPSSSSARRSSRSGGSMGISPFVRVDGGLSPPDVEPHHSLASSYQESGQMTAGTQQSGASKGKKPSPFAASGNQQQPLSSFWDSRTSFASANSGRG